MPFPKHILNRAELARIERMIDRSSDCWIWKGPQTPNGYGKHQRGPGHRERVIHRITWEHYRNEAIPEGLQLDHLCRNRLCCNPDHLEPVSGSENTIRQRHYERNKTHCPAGHPYDEGNTRHTADNRRVCRSCDRARKRKSFGGGVADMETPGQEAVPGVQVDGT